ncbi:MAG: primosomal protein N' [Bacilli bacterium]|nr:primosomal protein N' [Bacilli bacterium]
MVYLLKVIIERSSLSLDQPFTYYSNEKVFAKTRVIVPFNNVLLTGYVLEVTTIESLQEYENSVGYAISEIKEIIDNKPILNDEINSLVSYMKYAYATPLIQCYKVVLPPSLKPTSSKKIRIKYQKYVRLVDDTITNKYSNKQQQIIELLKKGDIAQKDLPFSIDSLLKKGVVESYDKEVYRSPFYSNYEKIADYQLTNDQKRVVDEFLNSEDHIYLLHGVTGSGKTEIYINLIKYYLKENKNVLFLVPEISLTPLMVKRIKERIDEPIAVFHSMLSSGEKYDEYRRINENKVRVVVGARSAIFAPLDNIGLIIMDEEHSESYKQDDSSPKYHTLDIALKRVEYHNCKLLLGSATPNLVTMTKAKKKIYHYLQLPKRINNNLATTTIVNMLDEEKKHNYSFISTLLKEKIIDRLNKNEQIILLLNRRSYAPYIVCNDCRTAVKCPHCNISLHYHKNGKLKCHYCGYEIPKMNHCLKCGSPNLKLRGYGTQKVEEQLQSMFNCKVARLDLDSIKEYQKILEDFESHDIDILIGTQIIAKGLDFKNVTLVGVIDADIGLNASDYRSSERTFDLLYQVIGRSGRGEKSGEAVIQTINPDNYAIVHACNQDYDSFFNEEYNYRRLMNYPPFRYIVSLMFLANTKDLADFYASKIKKMLEEYNLTKVEILGPSEPYIAYFNNKFRSKLIVKYFDHRQMRDIINSIQQKLDNRVTMYVDYNPLKEE